MLPILAAISITSKPQLTLLRKRSWKQWKKNTIEIRNAGLIPSLIFMVILSWTTTKRNVLTREKLLAILNKTEETVKLGISVKDVLPFFQQYRLVLRVFDVFGKMICRHDPETRNHNNKAMFCMVEGNHVYIKS